MESMLKSAEGTDRFIDIFTNLWHSLVESWIGVAVRISSLDYISQIGSRLLEQYASNRVLEAGTLLEGRFATHLIRQNRGKIARSFAEKGASGVRNRGMLVGIYVLHILYQYW